MPLRPSEQQTPEPDNTTPGKGHRPSPRSSKPFWAHLEDKPHSAERASARTAPPQGGQGPANCRAIQTREIREQLWGAMERTRPAKEGEALCGRPGVTAGTHAESAPRALNGSQEHTRVCTCTHTQQPGSHGAGSRPGSGQRKGHRGSDALLKPLLGRIFTFKSILVFYTFKK